MHEIVWVTYQLFEIAIPQKKKPIKADNNERKENDYRLPKAVYRELDWK